MQKKKSTDWPDSTCQHLESKQSVTHLLSRVLLDGVEHLGVAILVVLQTSLSLACVDIEDNNGLLRDTSRQATY